ncbi:hypothetical protein OG242_21305 [Streptomyces sp. NBC_00727]|uniref:hypothetical protein n=1 Tax=Streptomyces sp. NBC_00727 TaxID=2903675 RepID=UPI003863937A
MPIADARLQARGIQRSYAKGTAELNFVVAGQPGWEPWPTSMERLARTARLDLQAAQQPAEDRPTPRRGRPSRSLTN